MTDTEWIAKLEADFGKLQRNRQQVPLEKLETTYAKSYKALISRLTEAADWFADRYLQTLTEHWPRHPKDTAGNEWLERKVAAIAGRESRGTAGSTTTSSAGSGSRRGETRTSPTEPGSTAATRFTPAAGHRPSEQTRPRPALSLKGRKDGTE